MAYVIVNLLMNLKLGTVVQSCQNFSPRLSWIGELILSKDTIPNKASQKYHALVSNLNALLFSTMAVHICSFRVTISHSINQIEF
jgi:hypothetical protein